jgi:hypothetical protein
LQNADQSILDLQRAGGENRFLIAACGHLDITHCADAGRTGREHTHNTSSQKAGRASRVLIIKLPILLGRKTKGRFE